MYYILIVSAVVGFIVSFKWTMISKYIFPVVIVSLTNAKLDEYNYLSKPDYTTMYADCQMERAEFTMEYNYITTEKYIQSFIDKYQDIIP